MNKETKAYFIETLNAGNCKWSYKPLTSNMKVNEVFSMAKSFTNGLKPLVHVEKQGKNNRFDVAACIAENGFFVAIKDNESKKPVFHVHKYNEVETATKHMRKLKYIAGFVSRKKTFPLSKRVKLWFKPVK